MAESKSPWENKAFAEMSLERIENKFNPATEGQVDYLVRKMGIKPGDRLLDLGCGAGRHSIDFGKRGFSVVGVDISETMLSRAAEHTPSGLDVRYVKADLNRISELDLGGGEFDGAICLCESGFGVLGDGEADLRFLSGVYSLLRDGAYFAMTCFNALRRYIRSRDQNPKFDYIKGILDWSAEVDGETLRETQRLFTPSEVIMLTAFAGFKKTQIYSCENGIFGEARMGIEDVEMLAVMQK